MSSSILTVDQWNPIAFRGGTPKQNAKGGLMVSMISTQTNRNLELSLPINLTFGISDYINENGDSDSRYNLSMPFPNDEYKTPKMDMYLKKMTEFENAIIDWAVENSEMLFGEVIPKDTIRFNFTPILKYPKDKNDKNKKRLDKTKPPIINYKVGYTLQTNTWDVEVYDMNSNMLFPCDDPMVTPATLVSKMSKCAPLIRAGGIWVVNGKWGFTFRLKQCVVQPRVNENPKGKCQVVLSDEDIALADLNVGEDEDTHAHDNGHNNSHNNNASQYTAPITRSQTNATYTADSDDDGDIAPPAPAPVVVAEPTVSAPAPVVVKKIIKKAPEPTTAEPAPEVVPAPATEEVKKKIIKKKV